MTTMRGLTVDLNLAILIIIKKTVVKESKDMYRAFTYTHAHYYSFMYHKILNLQPRMETWLPCKNFFGKLKRKMG